MVPHECLARWKEWLQNKCEKLRECFVDGQDSFRTRFTEDRETEPAHHCTGNDGMSTGAGAGTLIGGDGSDVIVAGRTWSCQPIPVSLADFGQEKCLIPTTNQQPTIHVFNFT
jgi:hypothetical protein